MEKQTGTSLDCFRAQIKGFREDDEARRKYAEKEIQRQLRILKEAGRSDERFKEELKKAGIDVGALEKEYKRERDKQKRIIEELRKIEAPPPKRGRKERILLDQNSVRLPIEIATLIYPPAAGAWGDTEDCGYDLGLGDIKIGGEMTGDGWGWSATAGPQNPPACTLLFYYFPPRAGELTVEPHVDFQGEIVLFAEDHWYTSTWADLQIKLKFDLFQHYWDGEATETILDVRTQDIHTAFWLDENRVMSKTVNVSANDPVWIKLTVTHEAYAHSSSAYVSYDFRTGVDRRIRAEYIRIHMPGVRPVFLP